MRRAFRLFVAQPGFTAIIVAMIAVGIGATTAVFSVVKAVLLQPLPYADSHRLVWIWSIDSRRGLQQWVSYPDFLDWRAQSRTVAEFAGLGRNDLVLTGNGEPQRIRGGVVTAHFFELLQAGAPLVTVVNASLARAYFGDENPVGQRITLDAWTFFGRRTLQIVGVSGDVTHRGLTRQAAPLVYIALAQFPVGESPIVLKTIPGANVLNAVRAAVHSIEPDQPIDDVQMLEERIARSLARERFGALLLGVFAAVAVLLAGGGLYGLLSYAVARRTREVGIRVALGAETPHVLMLVLRQGLAVGAAGMATGLIAALGAVRLVEGLLFGVTATDPMTFGLVTALLALVALLACWIPARRASRLDPLVALRYE